MPNTYLGCITFGPETIYNLTLCFILQVHQDRVLCSLLWVGTIHLLSVLLALLARFTFTGPSITPPATRAFEFATQVSISTRIEFIIHHDRVYINQFIFIRCDKQNSSKDTQTTITSDLSNYKLILGLLIMWPIGFPLLWNS